jgi:AraC family transcriptional regulator
LSESSLSQSFDTRRLESNKENVRLGFATPLARDAHIYNGRSTMVDTLIDATALECGLSRPTRARRASDMCELQSRTKLMNLSIGFVEDLRRTAVRPEKGPEGFCSDFQVCLPYRGLFVWHVGNDEVVGDANQVVFCVPGESFRMSAPIPDGYAELIITPTVDVLAEIMQVDDQPMADHPVFRRRSWRADSRLQSYRTRFLHWATSAAEFDPLAAEASLLFLLRSAFQDDDRGRCSPGAATARVIRQTKEFLEAELGNTLRLMDIARAVGVSPSYLTDVFRRVEGLPVHRYLTHLRLSRALLDLPHTDDLTALAFNLGFSSHSHFSFAFRRAFGITPSQFRDHGRRTAVPTSSAMFTDHAACGRITMDTKNTTSTKQE